MKIENGFLAVLVGALLFPCTSLFGGAKPAPVPTRAAASDLTPHFLPGTRIVFQGDSITDGGRGYGDDPNHILGQDYAYLIAARCGAHFPDENWTFLNRGVSGNKVTDLAARWQGDALSLKPDILSILVGVNDSGSVVGSGGTGGVTAAQYEQVYDQLLQQALAANPNVQFVLCEPFVAQTGHVMENPALWNAEIQKRQAAVERLALKYHAPVVHFQKMFDKAIAQSKQPVTYWIWDGVHPTYAGHELMAEEWLRTVNRFYFSGQAPPRPALPPTPEMQGALSFFDAQPSTNPNRIVLGWTFQTGTSEVGVTSLGYLNDGATGTAAVHTVGLYSTATQTLLAPGVTVTTSGGSLAGSGATFTYVKLNRPLVLSPNTAYVLAATEAGTGWLQAPQQPAVRYGLAPGSLHCAFHFASAALVYPDQTYAPNDPALLGPNFLAAGNMPPISARAVSAPATTIPSDANSKAHADWFQECRDRVAASQGKPVDIIFIGDSITQNWVEMPGGGWDEVGGTVWPRWFGNRNALDFGVGADKTQDVLWRLDTMNIQAFHPKVAVVLIGTNNADDTPADIAAGVRAVVNKTKQTFPGVRVILMSILPNSRANAKMLDANTLIQPIADNHTVFYFDLASSMTAAGDNWKGIGADHLHLTPDGYTLWASSMEPLLDRLLAAQGDHSRRQ